MGMANNALNARMAREDDMSRKLVVEIDIDKVMEGEEEKAQAVSDVLRVVAGEALHYNYSCRGAKHGIIIGKGVVGTVSLT